MEKPLDLGEEIKAWSEEAYHLSKEYSSAREAHGIAKSELSLVLASKLSDYRKEKKNLGFDMALLMVVAEVASLRETYKTYITSEDRYKGLERLIVSIESRITSNQSIMKYNKKNDGGY